MIKRAVAPIITAVIVIILGLILIRSGLLPDSIMGVRTENHSQQIVESVRREEEVTLVTLGIQGIDERSAKSNLLGVDIAGTDRAVFIQYGFDAKLGIDGSAVQIEEKGSNRYLVTVPEFIFIGFSEPSFKVAAENQGVLGWVTPGIDQVDMVNQILNSETKQEYVDKNEQLLKDQAEFFYRSIVQSISPDAEVAFEFTEPTSSQ